MRAIRKKLMQSRQGKLILLAVALALMITNAYAQQTPKINLLQGDQKRPLTPEEREQQKKLDDNYKAATKKVPDQKPIDPWGDVRPTQTAPAAKKKQQ
jgi:hypothetical protein